LGRLAVTRSVIDEFARQPVPVQTQPPVALQALTSREREVLDLSKGARQTTGRRLETRSVRDVGHGELAFTSIGAAGVLFESNDDLPEEAPL